MGRIGIPMLSKFKELQGCIAEMNWYNVYRKKLEALKIMKELYAMFEEHNKE